MLCSQTTSLVCHVRLEKRQEKKQYLRSEGTLQFFIIMMKSCVQYKKGFRGSSNNFQPCVTLFTAPYANSLSPEHCILVVKVECVYKTIYKLLNIRLTQFQERHEGSSTVSSPFLLNILAKRDIGTWPAHSTL